MMMTKKKENKKPIIETKEEYDVPKNYSSSELLSSVFTKKDAENLEKEYDDMQKEIYNLCCYIR